MPDRSSTLQMLCLIISSLDRMVLSHISDRKKKSVNANTIAIHYNTCVRMINLQYHNTSDDYLLAIHKAVFPEKTKNPNHKVFTKKL